MSDPTPATVALRREAARAARIEEKRVTLKRLCSRLPAVHQTWSAREARDFKDAAANGMTVANNARATEPLIDSAIRRLENFYYF